MFEIRKIKKDKWLIILLVGLLLVVIAMPVSDIKSDQTQDEQQVQKAENASEDTYTDALETRLENALAKVEGVGNVKVMIDQNLFGVPFPNRCCKATAYHVTKNVIKYNIRLICFK